MKLQRYRLRTRLAHAAVYVVTLLLLFSGLWLLAGQEGRPSPLARITGLADTTVHVWLGWALLALTLGMVLFMPRGLLAFARETLRYDRGDVAWLLSWPRAALTGRFARHEGHFDPGQRVANLLIVACLVALLGSGVGLVSVHGGLAFVWLARIHTWATYLLLPLIAGHVLIAVGVLPGYRDVWRSMHLSGRIPEGTARRLWPGWAERTLADDAEAIPHPEQVRSPREDGQAEEVLDEWRYDRPLK